MSSSRILYTQALTRLLPHPHGKCKVSRFNSYVCYRYYSLNYGTKSTYEIRMCGVQIIKLNKNKAMSTTSILFNSSKSNMTIKDRDVLHSREKEISQSLARINLDLNKHGYLNREDLESIVKEIQKNKVVTSSQGLYLIRCCGSLLPEELFEERNHLVQKIWDLLNNNLEIPLDISHYNSLLRIYLENEHTFNPLRFLATIIEREILPDRVTYQRLLIAYCQKGDLEGATNILKILKHKGLEVDYRVFNAIVMGHSMIGDWEGANKVISSMSKIGLNPDADTYRELLNGYAKFGVCLAISSSLEKWKKGNVSFSDGELLAALYKAAVHGHSEAVDILLSQMEKKQYYNRLCVNVILQLVTQRKEEEAFKILLSMKPMRKIDGKAESGRFFIRHIVKMNCSQDKIIEFCRKLVKSEKNNRAFFMALEAANTFERTELVDPLLNEIKDGGSNLYSLGSVLASASQSGGEQKLIETLRKMTAIRLFPNMGTIKQHILPHLTGDNETLMQKLRSARLSFPAISVALLQKSLASLDFNDAIRITSTFYIKMNWRLYEDIATAYVKSGDCTGLAKLINSLLPYGEEDETKNEAIELSSQIIGSILKEICEQTPSGQLELIEPLLEALRDQGLTISLSVAQFVRDKVSEGKMTLAAVDLLAQLSSGELIPVPLNPLPYRLQFETNRQIEKKNIMKFRASARERNLHEALASKKELDARNVSFSDGLNLLLMDLYGYHGRLDEALDVFSQLHKNPDLVVLPSKIMFLSAHLLKGGRKDDAIRVLEKLKVDPRVAESIELTRSVNASAVRLMDAAAENGNVQVIQKIFDCLEQSKALTMNRSLLSSLVKVHAVRDDWDSALNEFDRLIKERRATPWSTELAAGLIEKDDMRRLDRFMKMNSQLHGEKNSLFDLSLAFLSCQRVKDAKKVLETPGLRIVNSRLDNVCAFYVRKKKLDQLENLVKISKNVFNVDRHMLYDHLLAACIKVNDPKRAVNVLTLMQEEGDLIPGSGFLRRLADFLTTKKMLVPFTLPRDE